MPLYGTIIYLYLPFYAFVLMPEKLKWVVLCCVLVFTFLLPAGFVVLLKRFKLIRSLNLHERSDRPVPIFLTALFYGFNLFYLYRLSDFLPLLYYFFLVAALFSVIITLMVSAWWKISMHMTGIGGLCGSLVLAAVVWQLDLRFLMAGAFLVAGIVGTSRLQLKVHTLSQVWAGFLAGFLPQAAWILLH